MNSQGNEENYYSNEVINAENPQDMDSEEVKSVSNMVGSGKVLQKKDKKINQFPSMLFEDRPTIEVNAKLRKRFLVFRVYEDPI